MTEDCDFGYGYVDPEYSFHRQVPLSQERGIAGSICNGNAFKLSDLLAYSLWDQTPIGSNAVYPGYIQEKREHGLPPSQITLLHL